jgi:flagellar biosynthetic protein FliQ
MTPTAVIELGRQAVEVTLLVSAPLFLAALVTGLVFSIFQAATQINEMTLSLVLAGPWMITLLTDFMRRLIESIPAMIG